MAIRSLSSKMAVTSLAMTAGILLITGFLTLWYFENRLKDLISNEQFSMLSSKARDIDDKIESAHKALIGVSTVVPPDVVVSPVNAQKFLDNRTGIKSIFDNGIFLFSPNGILIAESPFLPNRRGKDFSDREYIAVTRSSGKPYISHPFTSRKEHHHPAIMMVAPVFNKRGKMIAILTGNIDLFKDNFLGSLAFTKVGKSGYLYLFNSDRTIIIHPDRSRFLKQDVPPGANRLFDLAVTGFEGTGETVTSRGLRALASFKRLRTNNWILASNYPVSEAHEPVRNARRYFFLILTAGMAVSVLAVTLVMKHLTAPLLAVTSHVEALTSQSGPKEKIIIRTGDEIETLANTFNKMVEALDQQFAELKTSEERFRQMSENIHEIFWMATLDFSEMIYISPAYDGVWGRTCESLYKNPKEWLNTVHPDDRVHVIEVAEKSRGKQFSIEYRIVRPDGSLRWIHDRGFPVRNKAGQVYRLTGIAEDITERKKADEKIKHLASFPQLNPSPVIEIDAQGKVTFYNSAAAETMKRLGLKEDASIFLPGDFTEILEALGQVKDSQSLYREVEIEGRIFAENLFLTKELNVVRIYTNDITERMEAKETMQKSERRYRSLFDNMLEGFAYCRMLFEDNVPQDFIYLDVNGAFEKLTGLKNVVGKKVTEVIPGIRESDPGLFEIYARVAMTGRTERFEMYVEALSAWYYISVYSSEKEHFVAVFDVITERKQAEEALQQSEAFLNSIVENIPAMLFVKDAANLRFVRFNRAAEELLGYSREEMLGKNDHDFFPAKEADLFTGKDREVLRNNVPAEIPEETVQTKHQGERILHTKIIPIPDMKGNPRYLLGISEDITERKLAADMLRKQLVAIESSMDGIALLDQNGQYFYVNNAHAKVYGYDTPGELLGKSWKSLYGEEELKRFEQDIMPALWKTGRWRGEAVGKRRDGTEFPQEISLTTVADGGLICVVRDITERKQAEQELMLRNLLLTTQQETSIDGILIVDESGKIISFNRRFIDMWGIPPDVMESRSDERALNGVLDKVVDADRFIDRVNYFYKNRDETGRDEVALKDGRAYDRYTAPMYGPEGKYYGRIWYFLDITDRKKSENSLRESEERYRMLFESAADAICIVQGEGEETGRIIAANKAAAEMHGYTVDELSLLNISGLYPADRIEEISGRIQRVLRGEWIKLEVVHRKKDGTVFPVELSAGLLMTGDLKNILSFYHDITERKQAEQKIQRQVQRLAALRDIDAAITSSLDVRVSTNVILRELINQLLIDAADILLLNPTTQTLEYADGRGFRTEALRHTRLRLGEGYAGRAALERRTVHIQNVSAGDNDFVRSPLLAQEGFADYFAIPIITKGHIKGVLEIFHRTPLNPDQAWLDFMEALGSQAAIAIDNAAMFGDLERSNTELVLAYEATLEGWSRALDHRDKETEGHSKRVTEMTVTLARTMGSRDEEIVNIRRGALLHDIGKLGVPDNVLLKPGKLTDEEWVLMKKHPTLAYELLSPISFLKKALDIPYCHHEKWNGTGYPRGLKGEEIPFAARIFSIVDVWDALRSDRPYRPAWTKEKTMEYILQESGTGFDPKVVEGFINVMKSEDA